MSLKTRRKNHHHETSSTWLLKNTQLFFLIRNTIFAKPVIHVADFLAAMEFLSKTPDLTLLSGFTALLVEGISKGFDVGLGLITLLADGFFDKDVDY